MREKNLMIRRATLVKTVTDDGLVEMQDGVEVGRVYEVDDGTVRMAEGFNHVLKKRWVRLVVTVCGDGGWFPTELLRIE